MWLILTAISVVQAPQPALPVWMSGCWEQELQAGWTEECWNDPRAGIMMGTGRSGSGEQLKDWEVMQIEASGSAMTYYGAPKGENRTPFTWVPTAEKGVTFINEAHDYPQRIRYWREGRDLIAEVSLKDGSNARQWRYHPKTD